MSHRSKVMGMHKIFKNKHLLRIQQFLNYIGNIIRIQQCNKQLKFEKEVHRYSNTTYLRTIAITRTFGD